MKRARNYRQIREAVHGQHEQVCILWQDVVRRPFSSRKIIRVNNFAVAEKQIPILWEEDED